MKRLIFSLIRKIDDLLYSYQGPIRILFVVRNSFGFACQLPVLKALEKKSNVKLNITLDFEGCFNIPQTGEVKTFFDRYYISPGKAVWKKWHFVIASDLTTIYFRRHQTKIMIGHGSGFGNLKRDSKKKDYCIKTFLSEETHIFFVPSFAKALSFLREVPDIERQKNKALFVTGFPKVDAYFNNIQSGKTDFLQSLGLPLEKKTIVIFSHWTENSLFNNRGFELVKNLFQSDTDYNVIINGHEKLWFDPGSASGPSAPSTLYHSFKNLEKQSDSLRFLPMVKDPAPILRSADLFICDYSSIFIECSIMDKPILFFHHPEFIFMNEQVGELYRNAAFPFSGPEGICDLCTTALAQPNRHKLSRQKLVDFFIDNQGASAEYIADLIVNMKRVCGPDSPGWEKVKQLSKKNLLTYKTDRNDKS